MRPASSLLIAPCTADRLAEYRSLRDRAVPDPSAFFVGERYRRVRIATAEGKLARVGQANKPARAAAVRPPRHGPPVGL